MSNEVILNLSFDNQTVTDLTGNWTLDGTPNATYEQIEGRDGYSMVTGTLGTPLTLVAVDQEAIYNEYTIDFNLYVKPSYTDRGWFSFLNLTTGMNYSGDYIACVDNGLTIDLKIGGSDRKASIDVPTSRWVHITIISEYDSDTRVSTAYLYVDNVLRTYRQDLHRNGSPFAIGKKLVLFNRGGSSFYFPNTPGLATDGLTVIEGIHVPDQNPAISLFNLSRVFNNFCTWLKRQLSTVAFTGSYNDLSNKPTISTVNDGTLTIQQNGTTVDTFTANSSTNKTANIQCVDLSTAQTIGGIKTFTQEVTMFGRDINLMSRLHYGKNSNPSSSCWHYVFFRGNTATEGYTNAWYSGYLEQFLDTDGSARGRWLIRDTSENPVCLELFVNGDNKQVRPQENNAVELGSSTNKWKSFNGVEPSDLSLPSDTSITIDTTGFTWGRNFTFTPSVNGHLFINIGSTNNSIRSLSLKTGRGEYYFTNQTGIVRFTMPVYKGKIVTMLVNSTVAETVIPSLSLFPCQGNV